MQLSQVYIMLQSLSHLGTLPSVMCSASHPPARLEVLLASSWRQGWRAGGTSWVLSDTLLYELFQGFIQADLKNEIPPSFPPAFCHFKSFSDPQSRNAQGLRSPSQPWCLHSRALGIFQFGSRTFLWNGSLFPALTYHTPRSGYL